MFYSYAIPIPAGTTEASPLITELTLSKGILHRVEIEFPAGCRGLAHCQIKEAGLHQVYPTNPTGNFASDDYVIVLDDYYDIPSPYLLRAFAWNDDDTYPHTLLIRIGVLPTEIVSPMGGVVGALRKFLKLVGVGG